MLLFAKISIPTSNGDFSSMSISLLSSDILLRLSFVFLLTVSCRVFSQVKKTVSKLCSRLGKKKKKEPNDKDILVLFILWLQIVCLLKMRYNGSRTRGA